MAEDRPLPSWEDLNRSYEDSLKKSSQQWLEILLNEGAEKQDKDFEVLDAGGPAMMPTSSINPSRPRTLKAGYDYGENKLIVVFRDGTWWEYNDVPMDVWEDFKLAPSKGRFMRDQGLDTWGNMGPADINQMPKHRREQMNDLTAFANYMYNSKKD